MLSSGRRRAREVKRRELVRGTSIGRLAVFVIALSSLSAAPDRIKPYESSRAADRPGAEHAHFSRTAVQIGPGVADAVIVELDIDGARRRIELYPHSLRGDDFQVLVQDASGRLERAQAAGPATYRGRVVGIPASRVVASLQEGRLSAQIQLDGSERWHVGPKTPDTGALLADGSHAVYRESDFRRLDTHCGAAHPPAAARQMEWGLVAGTEAVQLGTTLKVAQIAFDADREFYVLNANSVSRTVADIEEVMNNVSALYEEQAGITYEITTIVVRTAEPDPYSATDHETLLAQFRSEWNANMRGVHRDVAHLMTGKLIANGIIGSAFPDAMCETCGTAAQGYGFSQSRFSPNAGQRRCLTAHELGHNWGALHCDGGADCDIMCSQIGNCTGNCDNFGQTSLNAIESGLASAFCVPTKPEPTLLPFCDTFDADVSADKWTYNAFGTLVAAAAAPSPPNVLRLDACCSACGATPAPDEVRSNEMQLGGLSAATLSYHTQYVGTAAGAIGDLLVEYRTDAQPWTLLNELPAGGPSGQPFDLWSHVLPPAALDDGFRVRFRIAGIDANASWNIDDVVVSTTSPDQPVLFVREGAPPGGIGASWATAYNDLQDALAAAECSLGLVEEVWVAAGAYTPDRGTGDRYDTFQLRDGIDLYGGFDGSETARWQRDPAANVTILSGEIGSPITVGDNTLHVVTATNVSSLIDGFTIADGYANGPAPNDRGAGLYHIGGGPTVSNCMFLRNRGFRSAGLYSQLGATLRVLDSKFVDNFASIGSGGAVSLDLGTVAEFDRCSFVGNVAAATAGALDVTNSSTTARDCTFSGNRAQLAGTVYLEGSSAMFSNCAFSRNTATATVGGIYSDGGSELMLNGSILWKNADISGELQSSQFGGSLIYCNYSLVQGLTAVLGGVGNINQDPGFINSLGLDGIAGTMDDDLHIPFDSAAANAGDPGMLPSPALIDMDGRPRVLCGRVDMGAFETGIADYDCNGAVDEADASQWPACLSGPGIAAETDCLAFDFDGDGDVDLADSSNILAILTSSR